MSKKVLIWLVLILVLGGGFLYYFKPDLLAKFTDIFSGFSTSKDQNTAKFMGNVLSIQGSVVTMHGIVIEPATVAKDLGGPIDLYVTVDSKTKYKKLVIDLPSEDLLKAEGNTTGVYKVENAARTESEGSLEDFKKVLAEKGAAVSLEFSYTKNNLSDAKAVFLTYQIINSPAGTQPQQ